MSTTKRTRTFPTVMTIQDWYATPAARKIIERVRAGELTWGEGAEELGVSKDALKSAAQRSLPTDRSPQRFDRVSGARAVARRGDHRAKELAPLRNLEQILKQRLVNQVDRAVASLQHILEHGRAETKLRAIRLILEYVAGKPGKKPVYSCDASGETWEEMVRRVRGMASPPLPAAAEANGILAEPSPGGETPETWEMMVKRVRSAERSADSPASVEFTKRDSTSAQNNADEAKELQHQCPSRQAAPSTFARVGEVRHPRPGKR